MVLKSLVILASVLILASCEKIPEWDLKSEAGSPAAIDSAVVKRWLWTCRGKQVAYRPIDGSGLVEKNVEQLFDRFRDSSLVQVEVAGEKSLMGTGVLWDREGHIVTLSHWLEQVEEVECRNEFSEWLSTEVKGSDKALNVSVLKLNIDQEGAAIPSGGKWEIRRSPIRNSDSLRVLASVYPGMIDQKNIQAQLARPRLYTGMDEALFLFQPPVADIFRGGVIVDQDLAFVAYAFNPKDQAWGVAIKMADLEAVVSELIAKGRYSRAFLGARFRLIPGKGFQVIEVDVGGPAFEAGLRVQDVLVEWNGRALSNLSDWPDIRMKDVSKAFPIMYSRAGRQVQTQIQVGQVN